MSVNIQINEKDLRNLRKAFNNSPDLMRSKGGQLMTRLKANLQQRIIRKPWQVGWSGGGAPVASGSLRDAHRYKVSSTELEISLDPSKEDSYGRYVHEGTSKMEARPWLDYAVEKEESNTNQLVNNFLDDVVQGLAR